MSEAQFLSVEEYAERLNVSPYTVYREIKKGTIPHVRVGKAIRIPLSALEVRT